jgi:hypothetical protein
MDTVPKLISLTHCAYDVYILVWCLPTGLLIRCVGRSMKHRARVSKSSVLGFANVPRACVRLRCRRDGVGMSAGVRPQMIEAGRRFSARFCLIRRQRRGCQRRRCAHCSSSHFPQGIISIVGCVVVVVVVVGLRRRSRSSPMSAARSVSRE